MDPPDTVPSFGLAFLLILHPLTSFLESELGYFSFIPLAVEGEKSWLPRSGGISEPCSAGYRTSRGHTQLSKLSPCFVSLILPPLHDGAWHPQTTHIPPLPTFLKANSERQ